MFSFVLITFHMIESIGVGVWRGHTVAESIPPLLGWDPKGLLGVGFTCFVLLLPFFAFREITRAIGHDRMKALLFEKRTSAATT